MINNKIVTKLTELTTKQNKIHEESDNEVVASDSGSNNEVNVIENQDDVEYNVFYN